MQNAKNFKNATDVLIFLFGVQDTDLRSRSGEHFPDPAKRIGSGSEPGLPDPDIFHQIKIRILPWLCKVVKTSTVPVGTNFVKISLFIICM